jgi:ribonucleoside-triphosphate reductase
MVPYVRKSFRKHFKDGLYYCHNFVSDGEEPGDEKFFQLLTEPHGVTEEEYKSIPIDHSFYTNSGFPKAYRYAMKMTEREIYQAVEGLYHNLNTLQSRSGNQLPFTSINYGTCTQPEGRMVTKALLEVSIEGLGSKHRTSIFPCGIFQCMKGVNREPGDPNYDLYQLALRSTAQRLYPNYANVDWSGNAGYDRNDPQTYFSTMG